MTDAASTWREALKNAPARDVLRAILFYIAEVERDAFVPGDPVATAHNVGRRSVGFDIRDAIVKADPMGYASLLAEDISSVKPS